MHIYKIYFITFYEHTTLDSLENLKAVTCTLRRNTVGNCRPLKLEKLYTNEIHNR